MSRSHVFALIIAAVFESAARGQMVCVCAYGDYRREAKYLFHMRLIFQCIQQKHSSARGDSDRSVEEIYETNKYLQKSSGIVLQSNLSKREITTKKFIRNCTREFPLKSISATWTRHTLRNSKNLMMLLSLKPFLQIINFRIL